MLGFAISRGQQPIYTASTTVLIDEAPGLSASSDYQAILTSERRTRTYSQLLTTGPLLEAVIQKLSLPMRIVALKRMVTVQSNGETQLIEVQVRDTDPRRAAQIANALVSIFADQTRQLQAARFSGPRENLREQMKILEQQILRTENSLGALESTPANQPARDRLEVALAQYRQSYANLLQSYEQVRLSEAQVASGVVQVEAATPPERPSSPRVLLNIVLAAVTGLLLAIGLAFVKETLDDSVKEPDELARQTGLPVLSTIPPVGKAATAQPIVASQPYSLATEAFRSLRTNLQAPSADQRLRSILITSPLSDEGKSFVAVNLGAALAQNGSKVVIVDADLRRPVLHQRLNVGNSNGLSELLHLGDTDLNGYVKPTNIEGVSVITSGHLPGNPSELVGSPSMVNLIRRLEHKSDVVLIDAPPVTAVTDAAVIAPHVDSVLLVVRSRATTLGLCRRAIEQLRHVSAKIVGMVITDVPLRQTYSYPGYYSSAGLDSTGK